ncbi:MAG: ABC transporter ATP-binding protein, partial [Clostridioides difficile]|nr:ABC transporter ATP-binding protein [Clostridioides difficile]
CVKYIEDYGNKAGVYFDVDGNEIIAVLDENHFKPGDTVYFAPDFKRIHLFDRETTNSLGYPEFQVLDKAANE